MQEALPIAPDDTSGSLHDRLAALGGRLIVRALAAHPEPQPQDETRASYAARLRKEDAEIDWSRPAPAIERQIRALHPAPGAQTRLDGHAIKIWRALAAGDSAGGPPGTVCSADSSGILVACGQGGLRVTELQRAGARRLPAGAFLAGFKLAPRARFGTADG
jgi:methionyl-tRNA formyltransferase